MPEDAPAIRQLLLACDRDCDPADGSYSAGLPSIERVLEGHGWSASATDSLCAADGAGRLAAIGWARIPPSVQHQYRGLLYGAVHPDYRRRGAGTFLLQWSEARARALLAALPDNRQKVLRIEFPGQRADAGPLYERQGFELHHVELEMDRDLRDPIPAHALPAGLTPITWAPEQAALFYDTCRDAFSTRPGPGGGWTQDEWVTGFTGGSSFRADLSWLAVDGTAGAGYVLCDIHTQAEPLGGRRVGYIRQIGVRPNCRRRGVASALLCAAMRVFRSEGLDWATLDVNVNNPEARQVYERLGFAVAGRYTVYAKSVDHSTSD